MLFFGHQRGRDVALRILGAHALCADCLFACLPIPGSERHEELHCLSIA